MRVLLEEMVLDDPCAIEAQPIGQFDLLHRFVELPLLVTLAPGPRHFVLEEQPELHGAVHTAIEECIVTTREH
jgi:hypothetical protein